MARMRKIVIGALNIKTMPHATKIYVDLLNNVYRAAHVTKIRGADWGTIGWLSALHKGQPEMGVIGIIYRFLNIDPREPWYDTNRKEKIDIEEDSKIPVPENLKPNLRESMFLFFPVGHRLFFDTDHLSPRGAQILFEGLFASLDISKTFGKVDVVVETDKDSLTRVLGIPTLTKLEVFLTRPNPDDLSRNKARIMNRFVGQQARTWQQNYSSPKGEGLLPDDETKAMMELAQSDGRVYAVGYNRENERMEESTTAYPLRHRVYYDPSADKYQNTFINEARMLLDWLRKRNK